MLQHRLKLALVLAFGVANIFPACADEVVQQESAAKSAPPTAAEAKVRIWTAIFIDGETKQPLEQIPVEVKCWKTGHREPQPMTFTTGSGGEIKIPLAGGTCTMVTVNDKKWWTHGWSIVGELPADFQDPKQPVVADPSKPATITLWKGTEVRGQLLKPDGTPMAGAVLQFGVYLNNTNWYERLGMKMEFNSWDHGDWPNWEKSVVTGDDGSFSIAVPPRDARSWVRIGTIHSGFSPVRIQRSQRNSVNRALVDYAPLVHEVKGENAQDDELLDIGKLQLQKGTVLKGRVVDAAGKPLKGVALYTSSKHGPYAGRSTESGADGSFEFPPMNAGKFTLTPRAELRNEKGEQISRDVQAVFVHREITLPESDKPIELTVQALSFVKMEFEWIDRRAKKGPVAYYGAFSVFGKIELEDSPPVWWRGETEKVARDGKEFLFVKVPVDLVEPMLQLSADSVVTASYEDDETQSGSGRIPLGDIAKPRRRIIYGDEPKAENK